MNKIKKVKTIKIMEGRKLGLCELIKEILVVLWRHVF